MNRSFIALLLLAGMVTLTQPGLAQTTIDTQTSSNIDVGSLLSTQSEVETNSEANTDNVETTATTNTRARSRQDARDNRQNYREERQAALLNRLELTAETRAENLSRWQSNQADRIKSQTARLNSRYRSYLQRAETILLKLETRAEVESQSGVDTSGAETIIAEAREALESAKNNTIEAEVSAEAILIADDATGLWAETRGSWQAAKDDLAELKSLFSDAVTELRSAVEAASQAEAVIEADASTQTLINF